MARTVASRSTALPTDRPVTVTITRVGRVATAPAPGGDTDRSAMLSAYRGELSRHMAVTASTLKTNKRAGVITSAEFSIVGTPYRPWTRAELEAQLRYLGIEFGAIVITYEATGATRSTADSTARGFLRGLAGGIPGAAGAVTAADLAESGLVTPGDAPVEMDRRPLIAGIAAIVVGLAILVGILVWGGK